MFYWVAFPTDLMLKHSYLVMYVTILYGHFAFGFL